MSKSIKNDADIMLLFSQHFSNVSVTESDTVFRVANKERELHKPRLWAIMDSVKVQTGTFFIYIYIYLYMCVCVCMYVCACIFIQKYT